MRKQSWFKPVKQFKSVKYKLVMLYVEMILPYITKPPFTVAKQFKGWNLFCILSWVPWCGLKSHFMARRLDEASIMIL